MTGEYVALLAYAAVTFIAFIGGVAWGRYRHSIKKRLNLKHYREDEGKTSHAT
jgi:hypothetical protein